MSKRNLPVKEEVSGEVTVEVSEEVCGEVSEKVKSSVNAEITILCWKVDKRINKEILKNYRPEYGIRVIITLTPRLTNEYVKGWGEKQKMNCIRTA